jgi:hypothetical protein
MMTDGQHYRHSISKRVAVDAVVRINAELSRNNSAYFSGYDGNKAGQYDDSVRNMVFEIQRMRAEVEEYRALKKALSPLIKALA